MKKIKLCHVICDITSGGVESVILNYFSNMDLSKFEVHVITYGIQSELCARKFEDLGFIIHCVSPKKAGLFKSIREMGEVINAEDFDIIHAHLTEWNCIPMFLGWRNHVDIRISHSHMAEKKTGIRDFFYKSIFMINNIFSTDYFACGRDAAVYLYGERLYKQNKVTVINNAIDLEAFRFNPKIRYEMRELLNLDDKVCVGHIGRFLPQKNHTFLLDIFNEMLAIDSNCILLLIGTGSLHSEINKKIKMLHIEDNVINLGIRDDINLIYQAMDVFLLPSLFEGLPVVSIEAQASGLQCYFSDTVTQEIKIKSSTQFLPLEHSASEWARIIIEDINGQNKEKSRSLRNRDDEKFNISIQAKLLEEIYEDLFKRKVKNRIINIQVSNK